MMQRHGGIQDPPKANQIKILVEAHRTIFFIKNIWQDAVKEGVVPSSLFCGNVLCNVFVGFEVTEESSNEIACSDKEEMEKMTPIHHSTSHMD